MVWPTASLEQVEQLTMAELQIREEATALQLIDQQEILTNFAFQNRIVNGYDKHGQPVVKRPNEIVDYEKIRQEIVGEKEDSNPLLYRQLSDRAKAARQQALIDLGKEEERGG